MQSFLSSMLEEHPQRVGRFMVLIMALVAALQTIVVKFCRTDLHSHLPSNFSSEYSPYENSIYLGSNLHCDRRHSMSQSLKSSDYSQRPSPEEGYVLQRPCRW